MAQYTPEQQRNIAIALRMTRRDRPKVRKSLLEAMAVEANFRHINYGHSSSQGVLQQRPDMGWGPYIPGAKGVRTDINDYLSRARRLAKQGYSGTAGQLAQAVQRSAFPDRYDQRNSEVSALLRKGTQLYGASAGAIMGATAGQDESFGASPDAAGKSIRERVSNHMMQQLSHIVDTGAPQALNSFYALNKMMEDSAGPSPEESKPVKSVSVGRGTAVTGGVVGAAVGGKGIHELFYDPLGAIDEGKNIKAIGGHSDHLHVSLRTEAAQRRALDRARRMGLAVGESTNQDVDPVHTKGSWHYKNYRRGGNLRMAADISGKPEKMAAFYRWVERRYR